MRSVEKKIQERLSRTYYPCQTEVKVDEGRIDILTPDLLIEIKKASQWKHGVGQLIAYQRNYPNHQLVLYLFGDISPQIYAKIKDVCSQNKIYLILQLFEQVQQPVKYLSLTIG